MHPAEVIAHVSDIRGRAAGTDAERRAAVWLRDRLQAAGHSASMQTLWVRPFWPLPHALHAALAIAGSALSVSHPAIGLALLFVSLLSMLGDLSGRFFWARRLTPRRATQNLVVAPVRETPGRVRLVLTANLDAGLAAAVYRDTWVRAETRLRRLLRGHLPSPLGLAAVAVAALAVLAGARVAGASGPALGAVQLVPSLCLTALLAVLGDVALAPAAPGANANASGMAAALAIFERLGQPGRAPKCLDLHLVLSGAGEDGALGLASFLRERARAGWRAPDVALLALEPCGVGRPRFFTHEGPLWARRLHPRLIECARTVAAVGPARAAPHASHARGAAYATRRRGWPALAVGALDAHDRPGRAGQERDTADRIDPATVAQCVDLCLDLIAKLDASLTAAHPGEGNQPQAGSDPSRGDRDQRTAGRRLMAHECAQRRSSRRRSRSTRRRS